MKKNIINSMSPITKMLGHRGARAEVLENSLLGFNHAQSLMSKGLAGIEFDVQLTSDNQLIVFHDDTSDRLYGKQGRVEQLPANFFKYQPFLDQMPSLLTGYHHIELEIKTHERTNYQALVNTLARDLASFPKELPICLTSFDTQLLLLLQAHSSLGEAGFKDSCLKERCLKDYPRGLLVEDAQSTDEIINTALRLQCTQVGVMVSLINTKLIEKCHRYGLSVTAWTVNDSEQADELMNAGVDWVITDYPSQLLL